MHKYIEEFLADVRSGKAEATHKTRRTDMRTYDAWLEERGITPDEVAPRQVHRFLREQGEEYADATVKSRYNSVNQLYHFLTGIWDVMEVNPVDDLEWSDYNGNGDAKKHQMADVVYVSSEEKEQLVEHVGNPKLRNELVIRLLWQTGVRRAELSHIELENIDRDARAIDIWAPKTESWRTVYYQPSLDTLMNQWIEGGYRDAYMYASESDHLFVSKQAPKAQDRWANRIVKDAAGNAGIQEVLYEDASGAKRYRITAHALRHGHAVEALKSGIDVRTVQEHMGHEEIDTTMKYLRLLDEDVKEGYQRFGNRSA